MTKTAVISGLHIRLDVPTKCRIVEAVLTKQFQTKQEQNEYIQVIAAQHFVNPVTVKLWCGKYQNTWKFGKALPDGTMSFAFATVPENKLALANTALTQIRASLRTTTLKSQTKYHATLTQADIETTKFPSFNLDELITTKKA